MRKAYECIIHGKVPPEEVYIAEGYHAPGVPKHGHGKGCFHEVIIVTERNPHQDRFAELLNELAMAFMPITLKQGVRAVTLSPELAMALDFTDNSMVMTAAGIVTIKVEPWKRERSKHDNLIDELTGDPRMPRDTES